MSTAYAIFKLGVSFKNSCKHYLLVNRVSELQQEITFIKDSFFYNALDFVHKASNCENASNIRFFLDSAYNNFSQSVKLRSKSIEQYTSYLLKSGTVGGGTSALLDVLKSNHSNKISNRYNTVLDKFGSKIESTLCDQDQLDFELNVLEMSYLGQALCEYHMREIALCMKSLDAAIGVQILPLYNYFSEILKTMSFFPLFNRPVLTKDMGVSLYKSTFRKSLLKIISKECKDYLMALTIIPKKCGLSMADLPSCSLIDRILKEEIAVRDSDDYFNILSEEISNYLENLKNQLL